MNRFVSATCEEQSHLHWATKTNAPLHVPARRRLHRRSSAFIPGSAAFLSSDKVQLSAETEFSESSWCLLSPGPDLDRPDVVKRSAAFRDLRNSHTYWYQTSGDSAPGGGELIHRLEDLNSGVESNWAYLLLLQGRGLVFYFFWSYINKSESGDFVCCAVVNKVVLYKINKLSWRRLLRRTVGAGFQR